VQKAVVPGVKKRKRCQWGFSKEGEGWTVALKCGQGILSSGTSVKLSGFSSGVWLLNFDRWVFDVMKYECDHLNMQSICILFDGICCYSNGKQVVFCSL